MKFKKLQRRLGVSRKEVVGVLELLWIATQTNARRGDIGRYTNEEIAIECDWEGDPDLLIESLMESGWLDPCKRHRLVVHDWQDHAPRYVHAWVKSQKTAFATAVTTEATTGGTIEATVEAPVEATTEGGIPNQTQPNVTKPNQTKREEGRTSGANSPPPEKPKRRGTVAQSPPSVDEVRAYCRELKSVIDPEQFVDHYTANGWKQSNGNPIKDWRAAVRTWERNDYGQKRRQDKAIEQSNAHKPKPLTASEARYQLVKVFQVKEARDWSDEKCREEYLTRIGPKSA